MADAPSLVVVLKGYPRLSETFIAQELLGLQQRGFNLTLLSLRRPTDASLHPIHREITAPVHYLPEYLHEAPVRVLRALAAARHLPGWSRALAAFRADVVRDRTRNRVRRFGQAAVAAALVPPTATALYAHFLHTPASVARYAALMLGLPWAASAHAKDIWTTPEWDLAEKLAEVQWCATCTQVGADHLRSLARNPSRVMLAYHGLDLGRFADPGPRPQQRDGSLLEDPVRLLSVGRLVEKKGFDDVVAALAALPPQLAWRWDHIGGGPLKRTLAAAVAEAGLSHRVTWHGAQPQQTVLAAYREADLFLLPARIARDGDRDGLPNVLMEAASQRLACVASTVSAIPEFIVAEESGLLVAPGDREALTTTLIRAITTPALRQQLANAGRQRLVAGFSMDAGIDAIADRLRQL
ncbi:MAG: colanic acid biosynthesis glycosyltransferase WcaL [Alphaproteobacteria bacterium]|nr:MAG: colanic acid biosynthesis glycosyltransferase WcaL [Alphaproteobacteria bacterium]